MALRVVLLVAVIAAVGVVLCSPAAGVERALVFAAMQVTERCEEGAPAWGFSKGLGGIRRDTRYDRATNAR